MKHLLCPRQTKGVSPNTYEWTNAPVPQMLMRSCHQKPGLASISTHSPRPEVAEEKALHWNQEGWDEGSCFATRSWGTADKLPRPPFWDSGPTERQAEIMGRTECCPDKRGSGPAPSPPPHPCGSTTTSACDELPLPWILLLLLDAGLAGDIYPVVTPCHLTLSHSLAFGPSVPPQ